MLDQDEIELLLDCTEAKEREAAQARAIGSLMTGMLARSPEERRQSMAMLDAQKERMEQRLLREKLILLRAKLVQLRRQADSRDADRIVAEAASAEGTEAES